MSGRTRYNARPRDLALRIGCASLQGSSHMKDGTPNQDSVVVARVGENRLGNVGIIAVSDGAGSAKYSQHGSRSACAAGVESLTRQLRRNPAIAVRPHLLRSALQRAVRGARQGVVHTVKRHGVAPQPAGTGEYACTMMLAVTSGSLTGIAHVGDGCVVAGDGREWLLLSAPENGEFANETKFLTNPGNLPRTRVVPGSDINCIAVITDGLQDVALSRGQKPYEKFWTPLYNALDRNPESPSEPILDTLLKKVGEAGKATDDCTIAVCVRRP